MDDDDPIITLRRDLNDELKQEVQRAEAETNESWSHGRVLRTLLDQYPLQAVLQEKLPSRSRAGEKDVRGTAPRVPMNVSGDVYRDLVVLSGRVQAATAEITSLGDSIVLLLLASRRKRGA